MKTTFNYAWVLALGLLLGLSPAAIASMPAPANNSTEIFQEFRKEQKTKKLFKKKKFGTKIGRFFSALKFKKAFGKEGGQTNNMAVAGFIFGVVALLGNAILVLGILGIVFSAIAMRQIKRNGGKGKGLAVAGLVCSIVGLVLWGGLIALALAGFF